MDGVGGGWELDYVPNANYNGPDSFTYKANDGSLDSNAATVSVTVTAVNDPPVAQNHSATTDEDTAVAIDVLANDSPGPANESGQTISVSSISVAPSHGSASVITTGPDTGKVRYTPNANFNGSDSFTYLVCDNGSPVACTSATVSVTVTAVNDAPVCSAVSFDDR